MKPNTAATSTQVDSSGDGADDAQLQQQPKQRTSPPNSVIVMVGGRNTREQRRKHGEIEDQTNITLRESPQQLKQHSDKTALVKKEQSDLSAYLYSRKTGELLGRTVLSWLRLSCYSAIFSACLAAYWGLCLWIFYQTLDNYTPKLQTTTSFIGSNPGLGFRPMRTETDPYSSLVWFRHGGAGNWDYLRQNLDRFLVEYEPGFWANAGASQTKCHWGRGPLSKEEACEFNKEWLSDQGKDIKCISEENYGYLHGKPCLLLKLNRIYGWTPEPFTISEVEEHPEMPDNLKDHIRHIWQENCANRSTDVQERCPQLNMVWLHCDGEDYPDKENIGTVSYTPWRGFPAHFFPYWNQLGYLQPIVMVQLQNPKPGVLINIQCTAWARGMKHDLKKREGSVHLEFLMD